ncbi:hypothetical protein [Actinocorallia longicatena]|uniref:Cupin n=1 Tax=Actinocorallia longicatena TaxID=111803 RepID=A0ABP6QMU2_9ACTN
MRYGELYRRMRDGTTAPDVPMWAREVLLEAAAGRISAIRHPLGFLCLPVERTGRHGVCVHVWSPDLPASPPATSTWHCHSWDLTSLLLYGRLGNVLARVADGRDYRVFEVASRDDADELKATSRTVRAVPSDGGTFGAGEVYALPSGVFHRTVTEGEAATVALGAERVSGRDLTLGPLDLSGHRSRRVASPPGETARLARRAADLVSLGVSS